MRTSSLSRAACWAAGILLLACGKDAGDTSRPGSAMLPGMPPPIDSTNIYAAAGPGKLSATARKARPRVYVPNSASANIGQSVPTKTTADSEQTRRLFSTIAPSRDTGAKMPVGAIVCARQANSRKAPPT